MNPTTTPGRILFDEIVPQQFRQHLNPEQPLDASHIKSILQRVGEESPEQYRRISHELLKLGSKASLETESSFGMKDLACPVDKKALMAQVEADESRIFANKNLTPEQRDHELIKLYAGHSAAMPERIFKAALGQGNNLARMVASGSRGTKGQLNSNIGSDWLVLDANSNPVPIPIKSNYAEGLSPAEYFASSSGTRSGLISTKFAVQDAGFLGKQLAAASHDAVVTEHDCGTTRGILSTPDDQDNVGAILAKPVGGLPAGSVLTGRSLKELRDRKVDNILVRSPLTCGSSRGLCATCAGVRERNRLPPLMDNLGLAASSSLAEPLSQGSLSNKHSGGVASSVSKASGAFERVNSLAQIPEIFPGGATVAQQDGVVHQVESAPQGGHYVHVGDTRHYVPSDLGLKVNRGDEVEAGDVLSEGIPNPAEVVRHKGIGEGRRYWTDAVRNAFRENNLTANRRNIEVLGHSIINHVRITDPEGWGNHLPDDIVEYNGIEHNYEPRADSKMTPVVKARNMFLEKPALHYSIGTRVTPRVQKQLEAAGEHEVHVHPDAPGFEPEMVRLMEIPAHKEDWQAQLAGSYLKKNIMTEVHGGGGSSDIHGISFLPALAAGKDFGHPPKGTVGY